MNVLLSLAILFFLCPGSAAGFISLPTSMGQLPPTDINSRQNIAVQPRSYAVEYDKINKQYKLLIKISIPGISTSNISAADAINLNIPVYNALQNPLFPNDSVENILYANLRLKKILDDYLTIQKKAKEILNGEDFKFEPTGTTPDFQTQQFSPQDFQLLNFSKKLSSINREFQGLVQQINENISRKKLPLKSTTANIQTTAIAFKNTIESPSINIAANNYLHNIIPNQYPQTRSTASEYTPQKRQYEQTYNSEDITLPWIIRVPLGIFHYLMTNVIEAIIYGILLLIIISIISATRSPK